MECPEHGGQVTNACQVGSCWGVKSVSSRVCCGVTDLAFRRDAGTPVRQPPSPAILEDGQHPAQFVEHRPRPGRRDAHQVGSLGRGQRPTVGKAPRNDGHTFSGDRFTSIHVGIVLRLRALTRILIRKELNNNLTRRCHLRAHGRGHRRQRGITIYRLRNTFSHLFFAKAFRIAVRFSARQAHNQSNSASSTAC